MMDRVKDLWLALLANAFELWMLTILALLIMGGVTTMVGVALMFMDVRLAIYMLITSHISLIIVGPLMIVVDGWCTFGWMLRRPSGPIE